MPIKSFKRRRGMSETIASVIMTAIVITVGFVTWDYAKGSTSIIAKDYTDGVISQSDDFLERYSIENVYYDKVNNMLYLYLYNYGSIPITVDSYVSLSSGPSYSNIGTLVSPNHLVKVNFHIYIPDATWTSITCQTGRSLTLNDRYYIS
jgi:flagellin-like protein